MVVGNWRTITKYEVILLSLLDLIFKKQMPQANRSEFFKTFTTYRPVFHTWGGEIYESELVRSAIHAKAKAMGKLKVEGDLEWLAEKPNNFQTWFQFLYRLSTILDVQNTAFIVPIENVYGETIGIYPVVPTKCEIVKHQGIEWLKYYFKTGDYAAIELSRCGMMTKFQYENDFFGEKNSALRPTMELVHLQNQAIAEAVKNSSTFRFTAKVNNFQNAKDMAKESKRFTRELMENEDSQILLFPNTYSDIKQIDYKPYVVDTKQLELIRQTVFDYFGVNEEILQNKSYGDSWNAFYEGEVEVFAIQFSEVLTKMLGVPVMATANRLQYMSNADKLQVSAQMADRGLMSINEIREIWNLPPLENGEGDNFIIRGEYYFTNEKKGNDVDD